MSIAVIRRLHRFKNRNNLRNLWITSLCMAQKIHASLALCEASPGSVDIMNTNRSQFHFVTSLGNPLLYKESVEILQSGKSTDQTKM